MKYLALALLLLFLTGCETLMTTSDGRVGLGTHEYTISPDGAVDVKVHSVYGGPAITIEGEGENRKLTVVPATRIQIEKLVNVLGLP